MYIFAMRLFVGFTLCLAVFTASGNCTIFSQCHGSPTGIFKKGNGCRGYIFCNGDDSFEGYCPVGTAFNPKNNECDSPSSVDCFEDEPTIEMPATIFACPPTLKDEMLYVASPDSCSKYYLCYNGSAIPMSCAEDLHFNSAKQSCDFPEKAMCKISEVNVWTTVVPSSPNGPPIRDTTTTPRPDSNRPTPQPGHPTTVGIPTVPSAKPTTVGSSTITGIPTTTRRPVSTSRPQTTAHPETSNGTPLPTQPGTSLGTVTSGTIPSTLPTPAYSISTVPTAPPTHAETSSGTTRPTYATPPYLIPSTSTAPPTQAETSVGTTRSTYATPPYLIPSTSTAPSTQAETSEGTILSTYPTPPYLIPTIPSAPPTTTLSPKVLCARQLTGFFPHPESAYYFYRCVKGLLVQSECPPGFIFDNIKKSCIPAARRALNKNV